MIVYKVVREKYKTVKGVLVSVTFPDAAPVEYGINKVSKPKRNQGPLGAFISLEAAREWANLYRDIMKLSREEVKIFEATAKKSKNQEAVWYESPWRGKIQKFYSHEFPEGTVLCDKITLLKEVVECYKVVKKESDGWRVSACAPDVSWRRYRVGKLVFPHEDCGPLCAFTTFEDALRWAEKFALRDMELEIYYSVATPSKHKRIWGPMEKGFHLTELPSGTVLCDSIILKERFFVLGREEVTE